MKTELLKIDLLKEIKQIICEVLELNSDELDDELPFKDHSNLIFDSINAFDIIIKIEKNYSVSIPQETYPELTSVKDICAVVERLLNQKDGL